MRAYIKNINNQYIDPISRKLFTLCLLMSFLGVVFILINAVKYGFHGNQYIPSLWFYLVPFMAAMLGVSYWARGVSPRLINFTRFYTTYFFIILSMGILINGIQYTPFPPIDLFLVGWDKALGIDSVKLMVWTASHPVIKIIFEYSYQCITLQLFFFPVILALFKRGNAIHEFLFLVAFTFIISALIYYFFPTAAPSSVFHSVHFSEDQLATSTKFFQIHHHLHPTSQAGGLIAFPSDHVIYALMCMYVTRKRVWLFLPICLINIIGIFSTVMLGWHYLIDVFGSVGVFIVSVQVCKRLQPNCNDCHDSNSKSKIKAF